MRLTRVEALVWVAIYLGLILLGLGLAVRHTAGDTAVAAWILIGAGLALVGAGVLLIWFRSRMKADSG